MSDGRLFWITGLSGAGKTTIGTLLFKYLKRKQSNVVFLDGDILRNVYQNKDYTEKGRENIAQINFNLCKLLVDQGIDVIIAVIGMKNKYRDWNRKYFKKYYEIYLKVPIDELIKRDSKELYSRALRNEIHNVYGIDLPYEEPEFPDLEIVNDSLITPEEALNIIIEKFKL